MFSRLLFPYDLAEKDLSGAALGIAARLAGDWGAHLRLLYVTPIVPASYLEYVPADFGTWEKARVEGELNAVIETLALAADRRSLGVRSGGVYHEVLAEAEAWKADLIVCGSHWPTLATYLVGSHATNIVRHAGCSVLVLRSP